MLQSSVYVGCFVGACLAMKLVNISNRKRFYIVDTLLIVGAAALVSDNVYVFLAGRFVMGVGCGILPPATTTYIREYCPKEIYGTMGGLNQFTYAILHCYIV